MDDHFWPAMYPAIAIGILLGLSTGRLALVAASASGGLLGGAAAYFLMAALGVADGIISLAALVGGAVLAAYLCVSAARRLLPPRTGEKT